MHYYIIRPKRRKINRNIIRGLEYSGFLKQEEDIPGQISIEMLENGRYMPREEK